MLSFLIFFSKMIYLLHVFMFCLLGSLGNQKTVLDPLYWSYRWSWATMGMLATELGPLEVQQEFLTAEPSLQAKVISLKRTLPF